ncbi:hypothetical protein AKO1_002313 [Acrasis kona]|uniref:Uncharacterized protein n=1 Tax=Acrasis kona TaxID=1008807 RepID=A0AAW2ZR21_9EUKA
MTNAMILLCLAFCVLGLNAEFENAKRLVEAIVDANKAQYNDWSPVNLQNKEYFRTFKDILKYTDKVPAELILDLEYKEVEAPFVDLAHHPDGTFFTTSLLTGCKMLLVGDQHHWKRIYHVAGMLTKKNVMDKKILTDKQIEDSYILQRNTKLEKWKREKQDDSVYGFYWDRSWFAGVKLNGKWLFAHLNRNNKDAPFFWRPFPFPALKKQLVDSDKKTDAILVNKKSKSPPKRK